MPGELAKTVVVNAPELNLLNCKPCGKMASAIGITLDGQRRVPQQSEFFSELINPRRQFARIHGPWCRGWSFDDLHIKSPMRQDGAWEV